MKTPDRIIEEWLVINCQRGDKKALELLIKRWQPKMFRRVYHTTQDQVATQDIVQDAWLTIIKKINTLKDPGAFEWWSLRIATTKAIDWIRSNQLNRRRDEDRIAAQEEFQDSTEPPEEVIGELRIAIQKLPFEQQEIVRMFYGEGLSVLKISQILDIPLGTVKSRLFKAREHLKKILKPKMKEL